MKLIGNTYGYNSLTKFESFSIFQQQVIELIEMHEYFPNTNKNKEPFIYYVSIGLGGWIEKMAIFAYHQY